MMAASKPTSLLFFFFFSSRRRHTRCLSDWSSDVCSSDLLRQTALIHAVPARRALAGTGQTAPGGRGGGQGQRGSEPFGAGGGAPSRSQRRERRADPLGQIGRASWREGGYVRGGSGEREEK